MNISSVSSVIASAVQSAELSNEISVTMAGKAMDAQKQEGANALHLIAAATGKGQQFDSRA
jgi:hypothetical protein